MALSSLWLVEGCSEEGKSGRPRVGGYSFAKLLGALVVAEMMTIFLQAPPSYSRRS